MICPVIKGDHFNDQGTNIKCQSLSPKLIVSFEWIADDESKDKGRLIQ